MFDVQGVLHRVTADGRRAVVAHDEIPGYMPPMTMEFDLAEPREATTLTSGDRLSFRLSVTDAKSWIDQIRRTGHVELSPPPGPTPATPIPGGRLPDLALIDQSGKSFSLASLRGRVLALTFVFTRCPLPNFCPLMSRNFEHVQRELSASTPGDGWRMLSVTIDPAHDTPAVLAQYAAHFEADHRRWIFATGSIPTIRQLGNVVGLQFSGENDALAHNLRTAVIDAEGRVVRVFEGNGWQPAELAGEIRRLLPGPPPAN